MGKSNAEDLVLLDVEKTVTERLQVRVVEYNGRRLADVRSWVLAANGDAEPRPTKKGISLRADLLPSVIEALQEAQAVLGLAEATEVGEG